jgi:hypothetical protein
MQIGLADIRISVSPANLKKIGPELNSVGRECLLSPATHGTDDHA